MIREQLWDVLMASGFIDPDDGTIAMWPNGDDGGVVWVRASRLCDTVLANMGAHLPPAGLPATLASVDDVAAVCRAAGMPDGDMLWSADECDVTADAGYIWPGHELALESVTVDGSRGQVAILRPGVAGSLLWHAIQAARSTS